MPADRARGEVARVDVHVVLPRVLGDRADHRLLDVLDAAGELAAGLRALDQRDDDVAVDARRTLVDVRSRDAATDLLDADLEADALLGPVEPYAGGGRAMRALG